MAFTLMQGTALTLRVFMHFNERENVSRAHHESKVLHVYLYVCLSESHFGKTQVSFNLVKNKTQYPMPFAPFSKLVDLCCKMKR